MDRAEATGLGVAIAGHGALITLFALGLAATRNMTPPSDAMEVTFVEETGPVSSAPRTMEEPAPSVGEEIGAPEEASGADASVPEPVTAPVPEPVRPPTQTGERRRPDVTRNAVPLRPAPQPQARPQPTPQPTRRVAQTQPRQQPARPTAQRPTRPAAQPGRGQAQRSRGFDPKALAESLGRGPPEARGTSPTPPAQLSGAQRQQLARNISGLISPCASRAQAPNDLARSISVVLRVTVSAAGVPTGHQLVSSAGTNATNEDYVDNVVGVAMRAVRACASRIATLPDDHYAIPGGWRTFTYRFRFPG